MPNKHRKHSAITALDPARCALRSIEHSPPSQPQHARLHSTGARHCRRWTGAGMHHAKVEKKKPPSVSENKGVCGPSPDHAGTRLRGRPGANGGKSRRLVSEAGAGLRGESTARVCLHQEAAGLVMVALLAVVYMHSAAARG
jgi:hypothetical protein